MRTSKIIGLKVPWNEHLQNIRGAGSIIVTQPPYAMAEIPTLRSPKNCGPPIRRLAFLGQPATKRRGGARPGMKIGFNGQPEVGEFQGQGIQFESDSVFCGAAICHGFMPRFVRIPVPTWIPPILVPAGLSCRTS
jgi:hypothetical protein